MNPQVTTVLRCRTSDDHEWCIETVRLNMPVDCGCWGKTRVFETEISALEIPPKLDLRSRLAHGLLDSWLPKRVTAVSRLSPVGDTLAIGYRYEWIPFEHPISPVGYDTESEWKAIHHRRKRTWLLTRLQLIGYDFDKPPLTDCQSRGRS